MVLEIYIFSIVFLLDSCVYFYLLSISNEQVSVTVGSLTAANDRCGSKPGEEGQTVEAEQVFIHPRCVPPECQINYFD